MEKLFPYMKRFSLTLKYFPLVVILFVSHSYAQNYSNSISGYVTDEKSGLALEGVNVFISGSTWGSHTDRSGYFNIASISPGTHELVISFLGYEVISQSVSVKINSEINFEFKLVPKAYQLDSISVVSEMPLEWQARLRTFRRLFLGQNKFAEECTIENETSIDFYEDINGVLSAYTRQPLTIINKALGYKIYCILLNFLWDKNEQRISFLVQPKFENTPATDKDEEIKWRNNRNSIYRGSLYHFLSSLANDTFLEKGYKIFFAPIPTESKYTYRFEQVFNRDKLINKGILANEFLLKFSNYLKVEFAGKTSFLKLKYDDVLINNFGIPQEPVPFETYGDWAKSGMADMLPNYFDMENPFK